MPGCLEVLYNKVPRYVGVNFVVDLFATGLMTVSFACEHVLLKLDNDVSKLKRGTHSYLVRR